MATPQPGRFNNRFGSNSPTRQANAFAKLKELQNRPVTDPNDVNINTEDEVKALGSDFSKFVDTISRRVSLGRNTNNAGIVQGAKAELNSAKDVADLLRDEIDKSITEAEAKRAAGDNKGAEELLNRVALLNEKLVPLERKIGNLDDAIKDFENQGQGGPGGSGGNGGGGPNPPPNGGGSRSILERLEQAILGLNERSREQQSSGNRLFNFLGSVFSAFAVASVAQKAFIGDVYTYKDKPTFQMMGATGQFGQAVGSAMDARAQFQLEKNNQAFGGGAALFGAGAFGLMSGNKYAKLAGLGGMALGALGMGAGLTGKAAEMYDSIFGAAGATTSSDVFKKEMAMNLFKPENIQSEVQSGMVGNLTYGLGKGGDSGALNYYTNENAAPNKRYAASSIINEMEYNSKRNGQLTLAAKGFNAQQALQMLGQVGTSANVTGKESTRLLDYLTDKSTINGASMGTMMGMANAASTSGASGDQIKSVVNTVLAGVADKKGELTPFAAEVMAPALMKAVQSSTLRNVGVDVKEAAKNVAMYKDLFSRSGGGIGKLVDSSPEYLNQLLSKLNAGFGNVTSTSEGLRALQQYGIDTPTARKIRVEGIENNQDAFKTLVENFRKQNNITSKEDLMRDGGTFDYAMTFFSQFGLSSAEIAEMVGNGFKGGGKASDLKSKEGAFNTNQNEKEQDIKKDKFIQVQEEINVQANKFALAVAGLTDQIQTSQRLMKEYIDGGSLMDDARDKVEQILEKMAENLGVPYKKKDDGGNEKTNGPAKPEKSSESTSSQVINPTNSNFSDMTLSSGQQNALKQYFQNGVKGKTEKQIGKSTLEIFQNKKYKEAMDDATKIFKSFEEFSDPTKNKNYKEDLKAISDMASQFKGTPMEKVIKDISNRLKDKDPKIAEAAYQDLFWVEQVTQAVKNADPQYLNDFDKFLKDNGLNKPEPVKTVTPSNGTKTIPGTPKTNEGKSNPSPNTTPDLPTHTPDNKGTGAPDRSKTQRGPRDTTAQTQFAVGGFTGVGPVHEPAGIVHKGEEVVSQKNRSGNEETLRAISAGQKMDGGSGKYSSASSSSDGDDIIVQLRLSGYSTEEVLELAERRMQQFAIRHKLV